MIENLESVLDLKLPSPISKIDLFPLLGFHKSIYLKRDDLIHPVISGNKYRKLKGVLKRIVEDEIDRVLSFGGGFSNHLHALSYCAQKLNFDCIAVVRGNYSGRETPMLQDIKRWGTHIEYVTFAEYKQKHKSEYLEYLALKYKVECFISEGGADDYAFLGLRELSDELNNELGDSFDVICVPLGTGTTGKELFRNLSANQKLLGFSVLKGFDFYEHLGIRPQKQIGIVDQFHFGGFGKMSKELVDFVAKFKTLFGIELDYIYNGKMMFGLVNILKTKQFPKLVEQEIVVIHTGGLQGKRKN